MFRSFQLLVFFPSESLLLPVSICVAPLRRWAAAPRRSWCLPVAAAAAAAFGCMRGLLALCNYCSFFLAHSLSGWPLHTWALRNWQRWGPRRLQGGCAAPLVPAPSRHPPPSFVHAAPRPLPVRALTLCTRPRFSQRSGPRESVSPRQRPKAGTPLQVGTAARVHVASCWVAGASGEACGGARAFAPPEHRP